jgi:hypothetical protein
MHIQNSPSTGLPRRRLSLRFDESAAKETAKLQSSLPRRELRRIVAEMVG